jgi:hypothetical protein
MWEEASGHGILSMIALKRHFVKEFFEAFFLTYPDMSTPVFCD